MNNFSYEKEWNLAQPFAHMKNYTESMGASIHNALGSIKAGVIDVLVSASGATTPDAKLYVESVLSSAFKDEDVRQKIITVLSELSKSIHDELNEKLIDLQQKAAVNSSPKSNKG